MWERVIDGPVLNFIKNVSFGHDKIVLIPTKLRGLWLTNQLYNLKRLECKLFSVPMYWSQRFVSIWKPNHPEQTPLSPQIICSEV